VTLHSLRHSFATHLLEMMALDSMQVDRPTPAQGDLRWNGAPLVATSASWSRAGGTPAEVGTAIAIVEEPRRSHDVSILIVAGFGEGWCFG
jgi:hypothetical protein